jgi:hypothetical protein
VNGVITIDDLTPVQEEQLKNAVLTRPALGQHFQLLDREAALAKARQIKAQMAKSPLAHKGVFDAGVLAGMQARVMDEALTPTDQQKHELLGDHVALVEKVSDVPKENKAPTPPLMPTVFQTLPKPPA